ncbi:MAG: hypothetical protein DWQ54_08605 [Microcystis flos-aquae TF09]|uniref:Uncharacterized protein n=1 Tax=Microcystis flos-aquae TF09 TaxID=2060473 RepID=A0A3E0L627_9CHRO|nr:MAG: hypothetical protein DWQ54_08605 [Microcystis flos-aquae TF09]
MVSKQRTENSNPIPNSFIPYPVSRIPSPVSCLLSRLGNLFCTTTYDLLIPNSIAFLFCHRSKLDRHSRISRFDL